MGEVGEVQVGVVRVVRLVQALAQTVVQVVMEQTAKDQMQVVLVKAGQVELSDQFRNMEVVITTVPAAAVAQ